VTHYLITQTQTGVVLGLIEAETPERAWEILCDDVGMEGPPDYDIRIEEITDTDYCIMVQRSETGVLDVPPLTTDSLLVWDAVRSEADSHHLDSVLIGWDPWTAIYRVEDEDGDALLYARALTDQTLVRVVRDRLGLTQQALADLMGLSRRSVHEWERRGLPDIRTRYALVALID
jgi:DNA-binding XRE family transcriptional regulator